MKVNRLSTFQDFQMGKPLDLTPKGLQKSSNLTLGTLKMTEIHKLQVRGERVTSQNSFHHNQSFNKARKTEKFGEIEKMY